MTACKIAVLMVILDALRLTRNSAWFEGTRGRARAALSKACPGA